MIKFVYIFLKKYLFFVKFLYYYLSQILMGPYLAQPMTEKTQARGQNSKCGLRFSRCQMQGWRRSMEDVAISELDIGLGNSIFGVFDGHGGPQVSKYVEKVFVNQLKSLKSYKQQRYKQALVQAFRKVDQMIQSPQGQQQLKLIRKKNDAASFNQGTISMSTGCTACVVLVTSTKIYAANAGDSRAVLCRKGHALPLTFDHKPQNQGQKERIEKAGGSIINGRVNGGLNLSRSLGDFNYKRNTTLKYDQQLITCKPDVFQIQKQSDDQFIIMGCDGIWQRYVNDSQPMITRFSNQRKTKTPGQTILANLLDFLLAKETSEEVGCDNMTSLLIEFI